MKGAAISMSYAVFALIIIAGISILIFVLLKDEIGNSISFIGNLGKNLKGG